MCQNTDLIREIIIVDSSTDDNVIYYLKSLNNKLIKIIKPGVKVIPGIQRNIGAKEAKGKILLFLDSDIILIDNYLELIHKSYIEGMMVGGGAIVLPEFQKKNKIAIAQYYLQLNEYIPSGKLRKKNCIPGCNIYCDNNIFFKAGCFPEIRAYEDTQFCNNVNTLANIWFIPEAKIAHIFRDDSKSFIVNQELLGNYIGRNKTTRLDFITKTPLLNFMLPVILLMKLVLISSRLINAGSLYFIEFLKTLNLIIK